LLRLCCYTSTSILIQVQCVAARCSSNIYLTGAPMATMRGSIFSILGIRKLDDKLSLLLTIFLGISLVGLVVSVQVALYLKSVSPAVDAAGRQRMLVQRMVSRAFMLGRGDTDAASEGRRSLGEFEEALAALRHGGTAAGVTLSPAHRELHPHLDRLVADWCPFKADYEWLLENAARSGEAGFELRLNGLLARSEPLLAAAQATTTALRLRTQKRINTAIMIQLALAANALIVFFLASRALRCDLVEPLEKLTEASGKVGEGTFAPACECDNDDEIGLLSSSLAKVSASIAKDRNTRKITADLLTLAVETTTLDLFLEKALETILSVPWLTVEPKGAIFLSDNASKLLTMKAQRGLHGSLRETCAAVPFGRCLCGRAAERGEIVFADNLDARHENSYTGIEPHGHYCVPIRSGDILIGVLNLYLKPGHANNPDETAQLENIAGLLAEIIVKKRAQNESAKMSEIIRQASEAVFITGIDGKINYTNEAFEKMTGFTAEEAIGKTPNLLKSGEHPPEYYEEMWTNMQKGLPWTGRIINRIKDGTLRTVQANLFPLKNTVGETTAYVAIQEDVSDLDSMEEQLRQSQKMEAVGRLAGGVAHDFNNILMAIDGYAGFIRKQLPPGSQEADDAEQITNAVRRAASLTKQLLAFSRKQKADFQPLDLRQAVLESEKIMKRLIGETISLEVSAADDVKAIKADPGQIDQVLMNLLVNAKDAMPDGGKIEIKGFPHKLTIPVPTPLGIMPPGEYSVLSVRDTGSGMDKETLSKIFDPFFTTKPKGKGTGLGLSIVYGVIKHHGAYMTAVSQPGKGSTFTAYFPALTAPEEKTAPAPVRTAAVIPPGLTVFLAEDDPAVLASVERMLGDLGADIKSFPEPAKMLEFAAGYPGKIQLLVTDIVMPGMDGFALAEQLTGKSPKTAVIYMSGYTDPDIFKGRLETPGLIFLQKPFGAGALAEAVAKALAREGGK